MTTFTEKQVANYRAYEEVREDGEFNMFSREALEATMLTKDEYLFVQQNYEALEMAAGDDEEEDEDDTCPQCNGCGEGQYDGTSCSTCRGTGIIRPKTEWDE